MQQFIGARVRTVTQPDSLPLEIEVTRSRAGALVPAGIAFMALLAGFLILRSMPSLPDAALFFALAIAGLVLLPKLARGLAGRGGAGAGTYRVDRDRVAFFPKGTSADPAWTEDLHTYSDVRWERFLRTRHKSGNSRADRKPIHHHVVALAHPDPARSVPLFYGSSGIAPMQGLGLARRAFASARSGDDAERAALEAEAARLAGGGDPRGHWERFAALLDMPAIDARDGHKEIRDAADLDKPVRDLAREGKLEAAWDNRPAPAPLETESRGSPDDPDSQSLLVVLRAPRHPMLCKLFIGVGTLVLLTGLWNLSFGPVLFGLLFAGAGAGIWYAELKFPRRLEITRQVITHTIPGNASQGFSVPLSAIEGVSLRRIDSAKVEGGTLPLSGRQIVLSTDDGDFALGRGLPGPALDWLHRYILAAVAHA